MSDLIAVNNGDVLAFKQLGYCGFACCNAASESKDQHDMSCTHESEDIRYIRQPDAFMYQRSIAQKGCNSVSSYHNLKERLSSKAIFDSV